MPNSKPEFSSLTFSERARFSASSDERSAWETAEDLRIENESLTDRLWALEAEREEVKALLRKVSDELDNMRNGLNLDSVVETGVLYCEKLTQRAELLLGKDEPKGFH
jgi:hypothetical protein